MKKLFGVMVVILALAAMASTASAMVGYEDEGAEVGITAIGVDLEEGMDVVATGVEGKNNNIWLPISIGAGVVLLGGGSLVLLRRKALN